MSKNKTEVARTVAKSNFSSRIDIIVPYHGQYGRVTRLIESIFRYTFSNVYQLILVDDASPNDSYLGDLKKLPQIECIRLEERKGFGTAMKAGFDHSQELNARRRQEDETEHPYCVFIQSDCTVEDVGWLTSLGNGIMEMKPQGVRMVGSRTNNPMTGDERQKSEKGAESSHVVLDDTHLSMHCFMVHRDLFQHAGGFIKEYPYGGYEDEEFAYRLRKYGFKQGIASNSYIKHAGGATFLHTYRNNPDARKTLDENRLRAINDIRSLGR